MKKLFALIAVSTLLASGLTLAKNTKEISPHGLGERSIFSDRATADRLRPVGTVCVDGEDCGAAAAATETVAAGPRAGDAVYNAACMACHATGAAGAPKTGDKAAWAPRIGKGMATLVKNSINGINAMPPMGMCMNCSEDEIKAAVEYMVGQSR
ncbi:MAG: cytochrome c5 family protein [Gammaproteobacteria bacterium HGW-Gammaproteobacteria-14]|nr:MAG: cytochrome c5 family protein [Gammaproteobacteria bacterium HGW-Gammaproteobacteria-14]